LQVGLGIVDRQAERLRVQPHQHLAGADEIVFVHPDFLDPRGYSRSDVRNVSRDIGVVGGEVVEVVLQPENGVVESGAQQRQSHRHDRDASSPSLRTLSGVIASRPLVIRGLIEVTSSHRTTLG
jgi:hypothetical protein